MDAVLAQGAALCQAYALPRGAPLLGMLPLSRNHGLSRSLVPAALLGAPLGLLRRFHHRSALKMLGAERYHYAAATPVAADVLGRCALKGPPPRISLFEVGADRLSDAAARAFAARFGVPARAAYGSTEMGTISTDTSPPGEMRPATVGRPLPGVEIRIGADPRQPLPAGTQGAVWARTPWQMVGYGYPPGIQHAPTVGGYSPTADVGALDEEGYLTLVGRSDECFKTTTGYLVSPLAIAATLAGHPGVRDAVVVPVASRNGALIGALLEGERLDVEDIRRHASATLPTWSHPHVLLASTRLPRLPGGKVDRAAARRRLEDAARGRP
jgi:long-chain acyl-CoA synthetase